LASKLVCFKNKKPTCQLISGGGLKTLEAKIETLDAQPPRARRHTHTAETTDTELRVLPVVSEHINKDTWEAGGWQEYGNGKIFLSWCPHFNCKDALVVQETGGTPESRHA
jgi:hypothetical protein